MATDNGMLDSNERGRLFVKVMGVKDLDLPISKSQYIRSIRLKLCANTS